MIGPLLTVTTTIAIAGCPGVALAAEGTGGTAASVRATADDARDDRGSSRTRAKDAAGKTRPAGKKADGRKAADAGKGRGGKAGAAGAGTAGTGTADAAGNPGTGMAGKGGVGGAGARGADVGSLGSADVRGSGGAGAGGAGVRGSGGAGAGGADVGGADVGGAGAGAGGADVRGSAGAGAGTAGTSATSAAGAAGAAGAAPRVAEATPTVTGIYPGNRYMWNNTGPTIAIEGSGFGEEQETQVTVNGTTVNQYSDHDGQVRVQMVPGTLGTTAQVTVTTPGGTSATGPASTIYYVTAPSLTSVAPIAGSAAGGTTVTLTGSGFFGAKSVTFGGTEATSFTVDSDNQITVQAPEHAAGTVDVVVSHGTVGRGLGDYPVLSTSTSSATKFTYEDTAPVVSSVSPNTGTVIGGESVTITGTRLTGATDVVFGDQPASFTIDNDSQITAIAPPGSPGATDIVVTTPDGGDSATGPGSAYTYTAVAPVVTTQPTGQSVLAGTSVTFTAAASGAPTPTVAWEVSANGTDWSAVPGATQATLTFTAVRADNGKRYRATFSNVGGNVTTNEALLTVASPPSAPLSVTATAGTSSISVSWPAATAHGSPVTGYVATAVPGPGSCTTTGATSCVIGAQAGTPYTVVVVAKSAVGNSLASFPSNQVVPTAPVTPTTPPATALTLSTDRGAISTARAGQSMTIVGSGYAPHSTVVLTLYSAPVPLGSAVANGAGSFSLTVTLPDGLDPGSHSAIAQGVDANGQPRTMKLAFTVRSATSGSGQMLAITGASVPAVVLLGLGLLAGGVMLLLTARATRSRRQA